MRFAARRRPGRVMSLIIALACTLVVALGIFLTGDIPNSHVTHGVLGRDYELTGSTVRVNKVDLGQQLYEDDKPKGRTKDYFLVVNLTITTKSRYLVIWEATGYAAGRSFETGDQTRVPDSGLTNTFDIAFEVGGDDLEGFEVSFLPRIPIYAYEPEIRIDLGLTPERVAELLAGADNRTVRTTEGREVAA